MQTIKYKTGGKQNKFAELMGWPPPYLAKLLKGETFGLQPVLTIVERLPEIDARWLLTGKGTMLERDGAEFLLHDRIRSMLEIEVCLPVLTPSELARLAASPVLPFSESEIAEILTRLHASEGQICAKTAQDKRKISAKIKNIK